MAAAIADILEFLQDCLDAGLSPNTIQRQVAALSSILTCGSKDSLSHQPVIRQFLRGTTYLRPPVVHHLPTWNLTKVLNYLTRCCFEPLREASLHFLSYKVAFLAAITSAR